MVVIQERWWSWAQGLHVANQFAVRVRVERGQPIVLTEFVGIAFDRSATGEYT
ncbi:hypothetical protein [Massilia aquatica]|uniref:hypothetical protein n=1 Tax=Massilia aquatica TaxID=2609000 RepID=UPI00141D82CB|nr:hypothetical protein [Massilia aquatica]